MTKRKPENYDLKGVEERLKNCKSLDDLFSDRWTVKISDETRSRINVRSGNDESFRL